MIRLISSLLICLLVAAPAVAGEFRDCETCPLMVDIPAGRFMMGTAVEDRLIDPRTGKPATNDSPQHAVTFDEAFAIGKYEVTVGEFRAFIEDSGYRPVDRCMEFSKPESFVISDAHDWSDPGFEQKDDYPVVCVSHDDARAYAAWLAETTGHAYRLPSEAEWEYAARAGTSTNYFWGEDRETACEFANVRSNGAYTISKRQAAADLADGFPCDDGSVHTSAAGRYRANAFGLADMQGNAWEWVADCSHKDYAEAPADGSPWIDAEACPFAVIRGGSYLNLVERSTVTVRAGRPRSGGATNMGFRIAKGAGGDRPGMAGAWSGEPIATPADDPGAAVFADNCAACHIDRATYRGVYGTDQAAVEAAIRNGGNNSMSMPAFGNILSEREIEAVARYIRSVNDWGD